jgi:hypothetical protein
MMKKEYMFLLFSILSLFLLLYSQYLLTSEIMRIFKIVIPLTLCHKGGLYELTSETSFEFCKKIDSLRSMKEIDCNILYEKEEEKKACENLKQAIENREEDCLNLLLGEKTTSVSKTDIEKDCETIIKSIK